MPYSSSSLKGLLIDSPLRAILIIMALFLASCATGPKPSGNGVQYAIIAATVSGTGDNADTARGLEKTLKSYITQEAEIGTRASLTVKISNTRFSLTGFSRAINGAAHVMTVHVTVRNTDTRATLRSFQFIAKSDADNLTFAKAQLVASATAKIRRALPYRALASKPVKIAVANNVLAKPRAKIKSPVPTARQAAIEEEFPERDIPAPVTLELTPTGLPTNLETQPTEEAIITPEAEPAIIEAPEAEVKPEVKSIAETEPEKPATSAKTDDELCVVTLENDCLGN